MPGEALGNCREREMRSVDTVPVISGAVPSTREVLWKRSGTEPAAPGSLRRMAPARAMPPRRITTRQSARELRMYSSLSLNDTLPDRFVSEFSLVSEAGTKIPPTYWQYQNRFYYR